MGDPKYKYFIDSGGKYPRNIEKQNLLQVS